MKAIKCLAELMTEELDDAEKYAKLYLEYKDSDAEMSALFKRLSAEELQHSTMEHEQVIRLIRKAEASGTEIPVAMRNVWDWEHGRMIEHEKQIKILQQMS